jgi:8-oxo-dGTP diphosphatase
MSERVISVVAALIRDNDGRVLLVRKRGTATFMQPGGKRDAGESDVAALSHEIVEELGCNVIEKYAKALGVFDCVAANEPGYQVRAGVYAVDVEGTIKPQAEIDEMIWADPQVLPEIHYTPLTRDHVLPLARN